MITLLSFYPSAKLTILTDPEWVFDSATQWARKWKARGWVTTSGLVSYA